MVYRLSRPLPPAPNFPGPLANFNGLLFLFPAHVTFIDVLGSHVSTAKRRSPNEVRNDLDGSAAHFASVLLDGDLKQQLLARARDLLRGRVAPPPGAGVLTADDGRVTRALEFLVASSNAFYAGPARRTEAGRVRLLLDQGEDELVAPVVARLQGVHVEQDEPAALVRRYDAAVNLAYLDLTRLMTSNLATSTGRLLALLPGLKSRVLVSGPPDALIDAALPGWAKAEVSATAGVVAWVNFGRGVRR